MTLIFPLASNSEVLTLTWTSSANTVTSLYLIFTFPFAKTESFSSFLCFLLHEEQEEKEIAEESKIVARMNMIFFIKDILPHPRQHSVDTPSPLWRGAWGEVFYYLFRKNNNFKLHR